MSFASTRTLWISIAGAVIIVIAALSLHLGEPPRGEVAGLPQTPTRVPPVTTAKRSPPAPAGAAATPPPITVMPTAAELERVITQRDDPMGALQGIEQVLYFYRQALGENPVGQNEDITAAVLGENSARAAFLPPGTVAIKNGKLMDVWGSPYWFHPVTGRQMEIRSAGPDRELFTDDDLRVPN